MSTYNKELIDWLIDWLIEHQRSSAAPRRLPRRRRRRKPLLGPAAAARRLLVVGGGGVWRREQLEWRLSHKTTGSYCENTVLSCVHFSMVITARSVLRKVLFLAPSVYGFLFVYEIPRELLNGFAPYSHGRRVWSLARKTLKVKVRGQRSRSPGTKMAFFGLYGGLRAVYV